VRLLATSGPKRARAARRPRGGRVSRVRRRARRHRAARAAARCAGTLAVGDHDHPSVRQRRRPSSVSRSPDVISGQSPGNQEDALRAARERGADAQEGRRGVARRAGVGTTWAPCARAARAARVPSRVTDQQLVGDVTPRSASRTSSSMAAISARRWAARAGGQAVLGVVEALDRQHHCGPRRAGLTASGAARRHARGWRARRQALRGSPSSTSQTRVGTPAAGASATRPVDQAGVVRARCPSESAGGRPTP
jgi:hypothetical protein